MFNLYSRQKNENQLSLDPKRRCAVALLMVPFLIGCHEVEQEQVVSTAIVFEGTLVKLAPDPGMTSGTSAVYRLARYRIDRICDGRYERTEIVVDHPIFTGKEFEGINVNDRLCITVAKSNKILARFDTEGLRNATDTVDVFYIADDLKRANGPCCDALR